MSALLREPLTVGPDLAAGNMLGSNLFNLFILGLTGLAFTQKLKQVKQSDLSSKDTITESPTSHHCIYSLSLSQHISILYSR